MARALMIPLFNKAVTLTLSAAEPPAAADMHDITDWHSGAEGPRVAGLAARSSSGSGDLTSGKVWVSKSDFMEGVPLCIGSLDTLALATTHGAFRRLFDVGGWEKIGISGSDGAATAELVAIPFEVKE